MALQIVNSSTRRGPDRILLYGVEGIGKSSWAKGANKPLFADVENRLSHLGVPCYPVKSWQEMIQFVDEFPHEEYKTLVIDTVDALESLLHMHLIKSHAVASIEDIGGGYGKGYIIAMEAFRPVLMALERLRNRADVEIIFIAHCALGTVNNPAGADYSKYEPKVHKRIGSLIKEWCDTILFACHKEELHVKKGDQKQGVLAKGKASGEGERVVKCNPVPAWNAKNHYDLPDEIELDYAKYDELRKAWIAKHAGGSVPKASEKPKTEEKPKEEKKEVTQDELDLKALLNKMMDKTGEFKLSQKEVKEKFYPNGKSFISEFTQEEIKESIKKVDQYITAPW